MKDFFQWAETKKYNLSAIMNDDVVTEKQMRDTTKSHAYPPQTGRGNYPKGYFNPIAADNLVYNKDRD
jgi:hypothetical protein